MPLPQVLTHGAGTPSHRVPGSASLLLPQPQPPAPRGRLPGNTLNTGLACWEGPPGATLPPPGSLPWLSHPFCA